MAWWRGCEPMSSISNLRAFLRCRVMREIYSWDEIYFPPGFDSYFRRHQFDMYQIRRQDFCALVDVF
jgi:hypothetical protein